MGDRRVRFIGLDAYVEAGGGVMRDLFEPDHGGWLTEADLLDRLVDAKLAAEADRIRAEGWKWVSVNVTLPYSTTFGFRELEGEPIPISPEEDARLAALRAEAEAIEEKWSDDPNCPEDVQTRFDEIDEEIAAIEDRPLRYPEEEIARAGVFLSIAFDGALAVERGYVRAEDEPAPEPDPDEERSGEATPDDPAGAGSGEGGAGPEGGAPEDDETDGLKPLPEKLVAELTSWRTLALQDAVARHPDTAYLAALHAFVLSAFYSASRESCLEASLHQVGFAFQPPDLRDSGPAKAIAERHGDWKERLPATGSSAIWRTRPARVSMSVSRGVDGRGQAGKWTDAATGEHGDLLDLIGAVCRHATLRETLAEARRFLALPPPPFVSAPSPRPGPPVTPGSPEAAQRLARAAQPIAGSIAETYLQGRSLRPVRGHAALRFHPRCWYRPSTDDAPDAARRGQP